MKDYVKINTSAGQKTTRLEIYDAITSTLIFVSFTVLVIGFILWIA